MGTNTRARVALLGHVAHPVAVPPRGLYAWAGRNVHTWCCADREPNPYCHASERCSRVASCWAWTRSLQRRKTHQEVRQACWPLTLQTPRGTHGACIPVHALHTTTPCTLSTHPLVVGVEAALSVVHRVACKHVLLLLLLLLLLMLLSAPPPSLPPLLPACTTPPRKAEFLVRLHRTSLTDACG